MTIHKTLSDEQGTEYVLVSLGWKRAITGLVVVGLGMLMIAMLVLLFQYRDIEELNKFKEMSAQRRAAIDEVFKERQRVGQWTYEQACKYAQSKGELCLTDIKWWADPRKYPLLEGQGIGFVPPTETETTDQYR